MKSKKTKTAPTKATIHGHPLAATWQMMKQRCNNPKATSFYNYGARGIKVCEQWQNDFWQFVADMGVRPEGHTLDRIDTNGDYTPENCRWADRSTQASNARKPDQPRQKRLVTYNGESRSYQEWGRIRGIKPATIKARLRLGWSVEEALGIKPHLHGLTYNYAALNLRPVDDSRVASLSAYCTAEGVTEGRLLRRVRKGMSIEEAVADIKGTPVQPPMRITNQHGVSRTFSEWAKISKISPMVLRARVADGWTIDAAMSTPVRPRKRNK